jgi:hypothetical protein
MSSETYTVVVNTIIDYVDAASPKMLADVVRHSKQLNTEQKTAILKILGVT